MSFSFELEIHIKPIININITNSVVFFILISFEGAPKYLSAGTPSAFFEYYLDFYFDLLTV